MIAHKNSFGQSSICVNSFIVTARRLSHGQRHPSFKGNLDINVADGSKTNITLMHVSTNSCTPVVTGDDDHEGEGDNQTKIDAEKLGSGS